MEDGRKTVGPVSREHSSPTLVKLIGPGRGGWGRGQSPGGGARAQGAGRLPLSFTVPAQILILVAGKLFSQGQASSPWYRLSCYFLTRVKQKTCCTFNLNT